MTTPKAAQAATTEDALPGRGLRLLGTMGRKTAPEALLLLGGDVLQVAPGDRAGRATVRAIEPGRVILEVGGANHALEVAG
ncbi:MAG: amidophosphoribosyltransferase [Rhodobacteraceae bacterium]|nr:amidophosphoribosyltransferase [Paracoccaceae bacterium]